MQVRLLAACSKAGAECLVLEYADGGSLEKLIARERISLRSVKTLAKDVLKALEYLQTLGVVHRDVKPANILLHTVGDSSRAKLAGGHPRGLARRCNTF